MNIEILCENTSKISKLPNRNWLYPDLQKAKMLFVKAPGKKYRRVIPKDRYFPKDVCLYTNDKKFKIFFENVKRLNEWEIYCHGPTTPNYLYTFCITLAKFRL